MFRIFEFLFAKLHGTEKKVTEWVTGSSDVENGTWFVRACVRVYTIFTVLFVNKGA